MALQDEALARRAAAGDAAAFATLYDRYERRAYNLSYRITGSPDDAADATQETFLKILERLPSLEGRELNFGAYVMTAARNASYDALARRKRFTPTDEIPEAPLADDRELPERSALRQAHQEQIRAANLALPTRQREVLALRELQDLSYGEVAQIMGMNQNSVAQLISRARINLRDGLRQTALGAVASASPQCDRALPLLAGYQDGVHEDPWLVDHLMECGACRVRLGAMEEAAVAYRQWLLLVPALWLREEVAEAAERMRPTAHRGRRLVTAAGATLVVLLALAFLDAEGAQTPTRVYEAAEPVERTAAKAPEPRASPVVDRGRTARTKKTEGRRRHESPAAEPRDDIVMAEAPAPPVETLRAAATPQRVAKPAPTRRPRPVSDPQPPAPTVAADPPPVPDEPVVPADTPTPVPPTPDPPCTGPNCPGVPPPPPPPCSSASGCPPPPPRVTCTGCGLVAPTPAPPRLVAPTTRR